MSESEQSQDAHGHDDHGHGDHSAEYWATYKLLCLLFVISVAGPEIANFLPESMAKLVVLITAFGIAFWKAKLVIVKFMHLPQMKQYVTYLQVTMLIFMAIFVAAVSPDVHKHEGATIQVVDKDGNFLKEVKQWENVTAKQVIAEGLKEWEAEKTEGGDAH